MTSLVLLTVADSEEVALIPKKLFLADKAVPQADSKANCAASNCGYAAPAI